MDVQKTWKYSPAFEIDHFGSIGRSEVVLVDRNESPVRYGEAAREVLFGFGREDLAVDEVTRRCRRSSLLRWHCYGSAFLPVWGQFCSVMPGLRRR
ncbi:hypothetical protein AE0388_1689 [Brevibacterium linens]|uniref:Uncharacterized protein n=1 Tax=Brevibacterium linens TaxID=1703 RepID=A0A0B9AAW9_BRELN|nr:hypothetical protein AE0388_1689 [Brevibacterium linens]